MKRLTKKEREIMGHLWHHGPMLVRELRELYPEPKPHFNTLSTIIRILEKAGVVSHTGKGKQFRYYPLYTEQQYGGGTMADIVADYFDSSYRSVVSSFVKDEKITIDELRELIAEIESEND